MPSSKPAVGHADEAPRQADQQEEAGQLRVVILSLIRSEKAVVHDQLQHLLCCEPTRPKGKIHRAGPESAS
jgi:hypothetical protein